MHIAQVHMRLCVHGAIMIVLFCVLVDRCTFPQYFGWLLDNTLVFWLIVGQLFPRHEWCGNRACTAPMGTPGLFGSHESPNDDDSRY